jgi:hypothetical protein
VLVSPHHFYGSPTFLQYYPPTQQTYDDQQQQQQAQLTSAEPAAVRSATLPQMAATSRSGHVRTRNETGETDESSVASVDFAHADFVDMPGSWRYRSLPDGRAIPVNAVTRRYRAPIPQSFLEAQQYASDSEQVLRSSSFRHQPQQLLVQSRPFGSIPTMNR